MLSLSAEKRKTSWTAAARPDRNEQSKQLEEVGYGGLAQGAVHLVHLPNVPHPACPTAGQEGPLVLVHCLHPTLVVRLHPTDLPGLLHDLAVPQQSGPLPEGYPAQTVEHRPCRAPAHCRPDHDMHQARRERDQDSSLLRHDSSLDNTIVLHYRCISVSF